MTGTIVVAHEPAMSDEEFHLFADTIPHIVWVASLDGAIEYFNRRGADYSGEAPDAMLGDWWLDLVHPDDIGSRQAPGPEPSRPACPSRSRSGSGVATDISAGTSSKPLPMRDAGGQIRRWVGTATDIDRQRRSQEEVRAAERQSAETLTPLQTMQSKAPIGFGFLDRDLHIVRENDVLAGLSGAAQGDSTGQSLADAHPQLWSRVGPLLRSVLDTGEPALNQQQSVALAGDGGRLHHTLSSYYPVRVEGETIGVGVVMVDVTERKLADQALHELTSAAVAAIAAAAEARDPYTAGHQRRVAAISAAIARELGTDPDDIEGIELAANIHDIGKLGIPSEILATPRRLLPVEFELVKAHAEIGADIIAGIRFRWPIAEMILQHHERMDGSGYPNQLRGGQILIGARIIAVADTVEAMASHRPYRPALGIEVALSEISSGRGTRHDPSVVDACLRLFEQGRLSIDQLD